MFTKDGVFEMILWQIPGLILLCVSAVNLIFYAPQRRGERREKDFCKRRLFIGFL
jgi:hypothetical protein